MLNPGNIIQDPKTQVLHPAAHPVNIVISANHPQGTISFKHPAAGSQPLYCKLIVFLKILELIPLIINRIDPGKIGTPQFLVELQVIRWVSKNQVN